MSRPGLGVEMTAISDAVPCSLDRPPVRPNAPTDGRTSKPSTFPARARLKNASIMCLGCAKRLRTYTKLVYYIHNTALGRHYFTVSWAYPCKPRTASLNEPGVRLGDPPRETSVLLHFVLSGHSEKPEAYVSPEHE